jgi:hypothetical protein
VQDALLTRLAAVTEAAGGSSAALAAAVAHARTAGPAATAVVLVEGMSDQSALATLAVRRGRDLAAEGVFIVPMGGVTNIGHFLAAFGPRGFGVRLAGLYDQGEEHEVRRSLARAGLPPAPDSAGLDSAGLDSAGLDSAGLDSAGLDSAGLDSSGLDSAGLERLGFFVCVADLEDELIRALGVTVTEQLIEGQGELGSFRTFAKQPAQRTRTRQQQLRRFMGTRSGRKIHYGHVLAGALDLTRVPRPLDAVLAHV